MGNTHMFQGDAAGGMLSGSYPNPTVGAMGTGTLSAGTATVSEPAVTAASAIFLTCTKATIVNVGALTASSVVPGTSFKVTSTNILDTSTFNYLILG